MFINKIHNWHKAYQIIDQLHLTDQITEEQAILYRKYALGNAIDDQLNPIDIASVDYAYSQERVKLYKDPTLSNHIKQQIQVYNYDQNEMPEKLFHRAECKLFSQEAFDMCICSNSAPFTAQAYKQTVYQNDNIDKERSANINLETLVNQITASERTNQAQKELELSNRIGLLTTVNINSQPLNKTLIDVVSLNCSNNFAFEGNGRKRGQFVGITLDQYKMLRLIRKNYIKNKQIRFEGYSVPNLYLLDSPTGTGKTENFILSQYLTKFLYNCKKTQDGQNIHVKKGINSLIFSNNELVALQTLERFQDYLYLERTNNNVIGQKCHRIEIILDQGIPKNPVLLISHNEVSKKDATLVHKNHYDLILSFGNVQDVNLIPEVLDQATHTLFNIKPNYQYAYICNTRYQYATSIQGNKWMGRDNPMEPFLLDIASYVKENMDILITTLYNYQFLNMFGILNPEQNIQTVVYDELDVFYQKNRIEEFHKFFFSQIYNLTAKTIIFASATLQVEFIDKIDYNFSERSQMMVQRQLVNNVLNSGVTERFPVIITNGIKITSTKLEDFKNILSKSWQSGNTYFYFDLETSSNIFASYAVIKNGHLIVKQPNTMSKIKGTPEVLEIELVKKLVNYKHIFITNRVLRNNHFFTEQPQVRSLESNISLLKEIPLLRMVDKHNLRFSTASYNQVQLTVPISRYIDKYRRQDLSRVNDPIKTLIITISDQFVYKILQSMHTGENNARATMGAFSEHTEQQSIDIYKNFRELNYFKLKLQTPFNQQLISNIRNCPMTVAEKNVLVMYDDFNKIGRGIDIDGLRQVILIIPLHYQLDQFGFSQSEFTQILGRVGRFRKVGEVVIITVDIQHDFKTQVSAIPLDLKNYIQDGFRQKIENITQEDFDSLKKSNKQLIKRWLDEKKEGQLSIREISEQLMKLK